MESYVCETNQGIRLNFEPLIIEYQHIVETHLYWVMQHWQGLPKPSKGIYDIRKFGYFIKTPNSKRYITIDADCLIVPQPVYLQTLQLKQPTIGILPTAVNFFPDTTLIVNDKKYYLELML